MSGQVSLSYMRYLGSSNFRRAALRPFGRRAGSLAAAIQYFGYGSMTETDVDGTIIGSFSPKDVAFMGAYSHDITDRLRGGINLKMIYSGYADYSAFAIATDLGLNIMTPTATCRCRLWWPILADKSNGLMKAMTGCRLICVWDGAKVSALFRCAFQSRHGI